jgi:hypothetical protein
MTNYEWLKQQIEKQKREPTRACIEWPFGRLPKGYGQVWADGKTQNVHRVAFSEYYGYEPENMVLHTCDNPPCFNGLHLYEGSAQDNSNDAKERGRVSTMGPRKLTEDEAKEIITLLSQDGRVTRIANQFGVSHTAISLIKSGTTWSHLPRPEER